MDSSSTVPLVSIVVPVFNGERYLRESLDSIIAQTYPRCEILVMDDASTDGTPEVAAAYGTRIRHVRQSANRGIYGNANDGIAMAKGKYVAVYHADDLYHPSIVEREVAFLETHHQAGAVFCQDLFIDRAGNVVGQLMLPQEVRSDEPFSFAVILNALLKYKNRFLRCPSCMVPADVYRTLGGYRDQEFRNSADLDMWLRIAERYSIGILQDYLFRYRYGHGNSAQRYRHLRTEPERYFKIMDLFLANGANRLATLEALAAFEAHRAEDHLMCAINAYIKADRKEARAHLGHIQAGKILASNQVQRGRLLLLLMILTILVAVPRISWVADVFHQRWHGESRRIRSR